MAYTRAMVALVCLIVGAKAALGGWLNPTQNGFIIQTFTTYQAITGNNTGTISTNGNSYQFAGDNTANVNLGGSGVQFRGKNDGDIFIEGPGSAVLGTIASLATLTNSGAGSLVLAELTAGQAARVTAVGSASLLLGAGTVSNTQCIVVGDGNVSHGARSVTAGAFWATGAGFCGNGAGLTNLTADTSGNGTGVFAKIYGYTNGFDPRIILATGFVSRVIGDDEEIVEFSGVYTQQVAGGATFWVCGVMAGEFSVLVLSFNVTPAGSFKIESWVGNESHVTTTPLCSGTAIPNSCAPAGLFTSCYLSSVVYGTKAYPASLADLNGLNGAALALSSVSSNKLAADVWSAVDARAATVDGVGRLMVVRGTQLVFVAGAVTNVLDADILHP